MRDDAELAEWLRRLLERRSGPEPAPVLGLIGSSRRRGNTSVLAEAVFARLRAKGRLIDLNALSIAPYDYDHRHHRDDFLPVAREMSRARAIVFASPVYWYAMSAQMKILFDRLSDLTETHKPLGRALAGKTAFALATSSGDGLPPDFERPFSETARYFDMRWGGLLHAYFDADGALPAEAALRAGAFAAKIDAAAARAFA